MHERRGFILLAVLVCMMSAILVATSLLFVSQTEAAGAAGSADAAQSRALQWSSAQVIMGELANQRERLLAGDRPVLEAQYTIYETASRAGVLRLLPVTASGERVASEASKLDINRADAEALAQTGMLDRGLAESLVQWRNDLGRPIQSVHELLDAPGITATMLYGPFADLIAAEASRELDANRNRWPNQSAGVRGLTDLLTVFSVEPAVQRSGHLRINLHQPWSDALARAIEDRFGAEAAALMKQVFESGTKFENDEALIRAMLAYKTPLQQWPEILDSFSTQSSDLLFGRLDINTAPREAIMGLPGVSEEQAALIVNARGELSPSDRVTPTWPVLRGIVAPDAYVQLAGRLTARSWVFRVRIACGEVDVERPDGPLLNASVQEMVIDCAGTKPRIAYLRDVTLLRDALKIAVESTQSSSPVGFDQSLRESDQVAAPDSNGQPRTQSRMPGEVVERDVPARRAVAGPRTRPGRSPEGVATLDEQRDSTGSHGGGRIGRWTRGE